MTVATIGSGDAHGATLPLSVFTPALNRVAGSSKPVQAKSPPGNDSRFDKHSCRHHRDTNSPSGRDDACRPAPTARGKLGPNEHAGGEVGITPAFGQDQKTVFVDDQAGAGGRERLND